MDTYLTRRQALTLLSAGMGGLVLGDLVLRGSVAASATTAPVALSYPSWEFGEEGVGDYWRDSVKVFEEQHKGVTVELTNIPPNSYASKMTTEIAAGQIPDIFPVYTNDIFQLIANDQLEPLDPYLAKVKWASKELPIFKVAVQGGKHYGIVQTASPHGLLYNKRLLDQAGVSVPKTPDEFLAACQAVKQKTGQWGYAVFSDPAEAQNSYITTMFWVLGYGGDWTDKNGHPTANSPATIHGMQFLQKLFDSGVAPKGMNVVGAETLFKDGKAAFMTYGPFVLTYVKTANPDLYPSMSYAPLPTPTHAAITGGAFFVIMKKAQHKDLIWDYYNLINQESWQRRWLEDLVQLPGQNIQPSQKFLNKNPWAKSMVETGAKYSAGFGYAPPSPKMAPYVAEFQKLVVGGVAKIWNGTASVTAGLDALQSTLEGWEKQLGISP